MIADLTPASRRQDHTTSPSASTPFVKGASTSTASRPAFVTIASRPLWWDETAMDIEMFLPNREMKYFYKWGWTGCKSRAANQWADKEIVMAGRVPAIHVFTSIA